MSGLKYEILYLNSNELNLRLVQVHNVVLITVYVITPNNSMQTLCEVIFSLNQKIIHHSRARKHFVIPPYFLQAKLSGYSLFLLVNAIVVFIVSLLCQMRIGSYSLFHVLANCITIILSDCFLQVSYTSNTSFRGSPPRQMQNGLVPPAAVHHTFWTFLAGV